MFELTPQCGQALIYVGELRVLVARIRHKRGLFVAFATKIVVKVAKSKRTTIIRTCFKSK